MYDEKDVYFDVHQQYSFVTIGSSILKYDLK